MIARVREGRPIIMLRHGDPVAALVSIKDLEELNRLRSLYKTLPKPLAAS